MSYMNIVNNNQSKGNNTYVFQRFLCEANWTEKE